MFFILRKEETKVYFLSNQKVSKIAITSVLVGQSYRKKKSIETLIVRFWANFKHKLGQILINYGSVSQCSVFKVFLDLSQILVMSHDSDDHSCVAP